MIKKASYLILIASGLIFCGIFSVPLFAACETACSDIADDETAFTRMSEHMDYIEAEMVQVREWQADAVTNMNYISQSIYRKMQYAGIIREILTDYFLYQRIQAPLENRGTEYETYARRLERLHDFMNAVTLSKESVDASTIDTLRTKLEAFKNDYYGNPEFQLGQQITQQI